MQKHGGNIYKAKLLTKNENILDFSANINPLGVPKEVRAAIVDAIDDINTYPDPHCTKLCEAISKYFNYPASKVVCGNGADDLIYRICEAVKPDTAIIPVPTFGEYADALKNYCTYIDYYKLDYPFVLDRRFIRYIKEADDGSFLALCNPNNPTGNIIDHDLLYEILDTAKKKNMYVLLDECFLDMTEEKSFLEMSEIFPKLIILKSFTKMYAIPGLRVGFATASDENLIKKISDSGQEWAVNTLAQAAASASLESTDYKIKFLSLLKTEKKYLYDKLSKIVSEVWLPSANFLFFRCSKENLFENMLQKGILIRSCGNYIGLNQNYYRVAVRLHNDNVRLIETLNEVINSEDK